MLDLTIKQYKAWFYISSMVASQDCRYLWKDGTFNKSTGYLSPGFNATETEEDAAYNDAPGFWKTKAEAVAFLEGRQRCQTATTE